ncbi:MAG: hypothetical protein V1676_02725 [Candidatus Diapherotrites archaeon]
MAKQDLDVIDIHGFRRQLDHVIERKVKCLKHGNAERLLRWEDEYRFKGRPVSLARKVKFLWIMCNVSEIIDAPLEPFAEAQIEKVMRAITKRDYGTHTLCEFSKDVSVWVRWISPKNSHDILKESEKWLKIENPYNDSRRSLKIKQQLITPDMFLKLLNAAEGDERTIAVLFYGCGFRPGEVGSIRRSGVTFNADGSCDLDTLGKTGYRGPVRLRSDLAGYVRQTYENAKLKAPDAPLLLNSRGKPLKYGCIVFTLQKVSVMAGLGKWEYHGNGKTKHKVYSGIPIRPTIFRQTHTTWCLKNMSTQMACKRIWGREHSNMMRVYSGITSEDANSEYDQATGNNPVQAPKDDLLKMRACFKCGKVYAPTKEVCDICNIDLNPEKMMEKVENAQRADTMLAIIQELSQRVKSLEGGIPARAGGI